MKDSLIVTFFILSCAQVFCQTVPDGQIRVYDSYQPKAGKSVAEKNKISINPLGVIIGDYPLYYERMFGNTFSLEVAAGVTYQNYLGNLFDFARAGISSSSNTSFNRNYQLGTSYSISPKVYLSDDSFEGSYLAFCYRHRTYKDEVTEYSGSNIDPSMKEFNKISSLTFNYGYVFHLGKGFLLDYYVGIGLRTNNSSQVTENYTYSNTYPYNSVYTFNSVVTKKTMPTGMMGLKLSYSF